MTIRKFIALLIKKNQLSCCMVRVEIDFLIKFLVFFVFINFFFCFVFYPALIFLCSCYNIVNLSS